MTSDTELPICGFSIHNYRSFGPDLQYVGPLQKMNIIIGENNSGKSNIIRFIKDAVHPMIGLASTQQVHLKEVNKPKGSAEICDYIVFTVPINKVTIPNVFDATNEHRYSNEDHQILRRLFSTLFFKSNDDFVSIPISIETKKPYILKTTRSKNY